MPRRLGVHVDAAGLAELTGSGRSTMHRREDTPRTQERDLRTLRATEQTVPDLDLAATRRR